MADRPPPATPRLGTGKGIFHRLGEFWNSTAKEPGDVLKFTGKAWRVFATCARAPSEATTRGTRTCQDWRGMGSRGD